MCPGKLRQLALADIEKAEKIKESVRVKIEHVLFHTKRMFDYSKDRYRGLAKSTDLFYVFVSLANLLRSRTYLLAF